MDGADVSPGLDRKRQLLPWSRRDFGEKYRLRHGEKIFSPRGASGTLIGHLQVSLVSDWVAACFECSDWSIIDQPTVLHFGPDYTPQRVASSLEALQQIASGPPHEI